MEHNKMTIKNISGERVKIETDGAVLSGKIFIPQNPKKKKGYVIFNHGLGYNSRVYELNGEDFASEGYVTLMYNMRAHTPSTREFTTKEAVNDLSNIINYLFEKYNNEQEKVGIFAHSTGGLISALAAMNDKRIKYISCVNIVTNMKDSFKHWFKSGHFIDVRKMYTKKDGSIPTGLAKLLQDDGKAVERFLNGDPSEEELGIKGRYWLMKSNNLYKFFHEIMHSPDIIENANKINIPMLLFVGSKDEIIPTQKSHDLYKKLKANHKQLIKTNADDHYFKNYWKLAISETIKFFNKVNQCCPN